MPTPSATSTLIFGSFRSASMAFSSIVLIEGLCVRLCCHPRTTQLLLAFRQGIEIAIKMPGAATIIAGGFSTTDAGGD